MSDAAHAELFDHPVYTYPNAVKPAIESWDTPPNYRDRPGGEGLPDKIKVWRVQDSGKTYGSVVARYFGFEDSPDAEIVAYGYNEGKEYRAVGIGRHGNVLQWGYSCEPSRMTEAGRALFLNCIWYIRQFDGRTPLVHVSCSDRTNVLALAGIINRVSGDQKEFFLRNFPADLYDTYHDDPDGLTRLYEENLERVYRDHGYRIDEDVKALGLSSNRTPATLERVIASLDDPDKASTARRILQRYCLDDFETPSQWRDWFHAHKDRIYFTDVGGYKFMVLPEGYLDWP